MKKILLFIILLIAFSSFKQNQAIAQTIDIIGKWIGEDKGEIGYFIFDKDGYVIMEAQDQIMGGKEFTQNGQKFSMTYMVYYEKSPIEIDFTLTSIETKESRQLLLIAKFINNETIKLATNFNNIRPTEFTKINSIVLTRVK